MLRILFALMAFVTFSGTTQAADVKSRSFPLPDGGSLRLAVPSTWQAQVGPRNYGKGKGLRVVFKSRTNPVFAVVGTAIRDARTGSPASMLAGVKKRVAWNAEQVKRKATERKISIRAFKGPAAAGYYFSATDKAPKPGGYKFMTQGTSQVGPLMVGFTALRRNARDSASNDALAMMRSARYDGGRTPARDARSAPAPRAKPSVNAAPTALTPSRSRLSPTTETAGGGGAFRIQLGSIKTEDRARKEAARLARVHKEILAGRTISLARRDLGAKGVYFRMMAGPYGSRADAAETCRKLAALKQGCIVVNP